MKKQVYYFGVLKKPKVICLLDPVIINEKNVLQDFEYEQTVTSENNLSNRGCFFIYFKTEEELQKYIKDFKLLKPSNYGRKDASIYFLEDKKLVLFKISKHYREEHAFKKVYDIIKELKLFKKEDIIRTDINFYEEFIEENTKAKISIWNPYYCFFTLEAKDYKLLKEKIKKLYPLNKK